MSTPLGTLIDGYPPTDLGNAQRLIHAHGHDLRYVYAWGKWLVWDGQRWARDESGEVERRAKAVIADLRAMAALCNEGLQDLPKESPAYEMYTACQSSFLKWAQDSETPSAIRNMLSMAQSEPGVAVHPDQLDAHPWLLNCTNGTLDLRTGELRPHSRMDLITEQVPVPYDREARSAVWEQFLQDVTDGDSSMIDFLQRAVGYSLTGDTREEKLFFVHGPGATGKSTFIKAVQGTLGSYARTADFETFLARRDIGGPRPELARLVGARLVASVEVADGRKLAEGLVKQVTGGDKIATRALYKDVFEYTPQFKLWLVANDAPRMRYEDDGLWRRILRVPFEHIVPKEQRKPAIKKELCDPDTSGAAILAWAVQGCLAWQQGGLPVPEAIRDATARLQLEMDPIRDFMDDCCALDPVASVEVSALYAAYQEWAQANGERWPLTAKKFGEHLTGKGYAPERGTGGKRIRRGLTLRSRYAWPIAA